MLRGRSSHPANERALLPGLKFGGVQTNAIHAGTAHDVDRPRDFGEQDRVVSFDEGDLLRAFLKDLLDPRAQAFPRNIVLVDLELSAGRHRHYTRKILPRRVLLLVARSWLRDECLKSP